MKPLVTFPEDFHLNLLPKVIQEVDEKGYVRAVVGAWQDRVEELRALVDQYASLVDPTFDQARTPNCLYVTFTSVDGKEVQRAMFLNENLAPAYAYLTDPSAQAEMMQAYADQVDLADPNAAANVINLWAEGVLNVQDGFVSKVELGYNPRMAVSKPTLGLLAKTLGVMPLPDDIDPQAYRRVVRDQLAWVRSKGTPRALSHRMYALGFSEVLFVPLWSRLSPRKALSLLERKGEFSETSPAEFDQRGTADCYPESSDYNPEELRDGPFHLWEQACSFLDQASFYTSCNQSSPFIRVKLHGASDANHRRAWTTYSSYLQGDVVTHGGKAYIATAFPAGEPGTSTSVGWTRLYTPNPGSYVLTGGAENVRASVTIPGTDEDDPENPVIVDNSGLTIEAIAPGSSYNGVEVVVSDWVSVGHVRVTDVAQAQRFTVGNFVGGAYKLSYVGGSWLWNGTTYAVSRAPATSPGWFMTFYAGDEAGAFHLPEPEPATGYDTAEVAMMSCRNLAYEFTHPGGEVWLEFSAPSYTNNVNGVQPPYFRLDHQDAEVRTLSVYTRLSRVKYRSSSFDVIVANGDTPSQPIQPNEALRTDPGLVWPLTATAPWRPFGGNPLAQVGVVDGGGNTVLQVNEAKLKSAEALASAAVDDWRPATRFPRKVSVGLVISDSFRVAPSDRSSVLFTTDGQTSYSGNSTNPLPPVLPRIVGSGEPIPECGVWQTFDPLTLIAKPGTGYPFAIPYYMASDYNLQETWVVDLGHRWAWIVDETTNTIKQYVDTYSEYGNLKVYYDRPTGQMIMFTGLGDLYFFDTFSKILVRSVTGVTDNPNPPNMTFDPEGRRVFITPFMNYSGDPRLRIVDVDTYNVIYDEPMPYATSAIVWCPNINRLCVIGSVEGGPLYYLFDPLTDSWTSSTTLSPATVNYYASYVSTSGHVFVGRNVDPGVFFIDVVEDTIAFEVPDATGSSLVVHTCSGSIFFGSVLIYEYEYVEGSYNLLNTYTDSEYQYTLNLLHVRRTNTLFSIKWNPNPSKLVTLPQA